MADGDGNVLGEGSVVSGRDMYVGLAGDWGTAIIGRGDTPYKQAHTGFDLFSDQIGDMNFTAGFQDFRTDNMIAYISPEFAGLTVAGAIVEPGGAGLRLGGWNAIPYKENASTSPVGFYGSTFDNSGLTTQADGWADAWSLAGIYKNAGIKAALAYESVNEDIFCPKGVRCSGLDDWDKWVAGIGYSTDLFAVNFVYEDKIDFAGTYYINGEVNFGNNTVKALYATTDADSKGHKTVGRAVDTDSWAVGYDYNFSKRSTVYAQYANKDVDGRKNFGSSKVGDWDGWSVGMIHKF